MRHPAGSNPCRICAIIFIFGQKIICVITQKIYFPHLMQQLKFRNKFFGFGFIEIPSPSFPSSITAAPTRAITLPACARRGLNKGAPGERVGPLPSRPPLANPPIPRKLRRGLHQRFPGSQKPLFTAGEWRLLASFASRLRPDRAPRRCFAGGPGRMARNIPVRSCVYVVCRQTDG